MDIEVLKAPSSGRCAATFSPRGEEGAKIAAGVTSPQRGEVGSPRSGETGEGVLFTITAETVADIPAREALLDRAMGPRRRKKSSEKLRRGRRSSEGLAFVARDEAGTVVGTVRLWDVGFEIAPSSGPSGHLLPEGRRGREIAAGGSSPQRGEVGSPRSGETGERVIHASALLLGPLAVDPACKNAGIGSALMRHALAEAKRLGHGAILLVGDAPYYARFGFSAEKTGDLAMPGPYERHRLLALELTEGALDGAHGVIRATGRKLKTQPARLRAAA